MAAAWQGGSPGQIGSRCRVARATGSWDASLSLKSGGNSKDDAMQIIGIGKQTHHRRDPPVSGHQQWPSTGIGAWIAAWSQLNRIGAHIHLDHIRQQEDAAPTGQAAIGIDHGQDEMVISKLAWIDMQLYLILIYH